MFFKEFTINNTTYKARLTAKACVMCERKIGQNPINIFTNMQEGQLPKLESLLTILHCSLTDNNHGITMDDVYELYDKYCDEGGTLLSLVNLICDIFDVSGFVPKEEIKN